PFCQKRKTLTFFSNSYVRNETPPFERPRRSFALACCHGLCKHLISTLSDKALPPFNFVELPGSQQLYWRFDSKITITLSRSLPSLVNDCSFCGIEPVRRMRDL